jgi:hypothetical protein
MDTRKLRHMGIENLAECAPKAQFEFCYCIKVQVCKVLHFAEFFHFATLTARSKNHGSKLLCALLVEELLKECYRQCQECQRSRWQPWPQQRSCQPC